MNDTAQSAKPADQPKPETPLPDGALVILPLRNAVLFPGIVTPLNLGRPQSIAGAQAAAQADRPIGVLLQSDPTVESPGPEHLHRQKERPTRLQTLSHSGVEMHRPPEITIRFTKLTTNEIRSK